MPITTSEVCARAAIGAKAAVHVPLAIVEDIEPESQLEILVGAPEGVSGQVVIDLGLVEV
jgi:assimilatory nitrate reductase catalytic subunit